MNILITGASSGIGRALTQYLVSQNHSVWGISRSKEKLALLQKQLGSQRFSYTAIDVSNREEIEIITRNMQTKKFVPDVIILGAAVFLDDLENGPDVTRVEETFSINVFGCLYIIDAFLPYFLKQKRGHFIALSSIAAFRPNQWSISYPASKAALSLLFRGLDIRYCTDGVLFSNVYLGPVATTMWEGKQSFLVPSPEYIAPKIARVMKTHSRYVFAPFLSTLLFRLLFLLPDTWYTKLSGFAKQ